MRKRPKTTNPTSDCTTTVVPTGPVLASTPPTKARSPSVARLSSGMLAVNNPNNAASVSPTTAIDIE
jgi:hypothetical protein